jgi:hypothetical protein
MQSALHVTQRSVIKRRGNVALGAVSTQILGRVEAGLDAARTLCVYEVNQGPHQLGVIAVVQAAHHLKHRESIRLPQALLGSIAGRDFCRVRPNRCLGCGEELVVRGEPLKLLRAHGGSKVLQAQGDHQNVQALLIWFQQD